MFTSFLKVFLWKRMDLLYSYIIFLKICFVRLYFIRYCCILVFIGNENKQCECYHFTYTVLTVRMGVVLYGRTSYVNDNILTFLRFSRNDYYSICLDYCNSSNFEQIIKAPHMLCQALWCFI